MEMGAQGRRHPPLCAGLCADVSTPHDLSLDNVLFTQFVRLLKGKLEKRSGHLLITYSLFLLLDLQKEPTS